MENRSQLEELYILREVLSERASKDSLFNFKPTVKQRPFIDSVLGDKCFENWFVAANRAGKSEAGAYIGACFARFGQEPTGHSQAKDSGIEVRDRATSGWVSSVTFSESRDIIQPKIFDNGFCPPGNAPPFIPQREIADWRISDKILKLKNGSLVGFKSADSGISSYQGAEKDWIHFDEEHPRNIYGEACIRVGAGKRLRIFGTATLLPPEGRIGGVTWVYSEILKPFMEGRRKDIGCFSASIYDNPYLLADELVRLESRYPPESTEGRIRLGGEWLPGLSGARAYVSFDSRLHVRPQPAPQIRRPLCWIWDFNVEPMVSIVGQRDGKLFRILKVLMLEEGNITEMCQMFVDFYPRHYGEIWVYGDATGNERSAQTRMTSYRIIQNAMRQYGAPIRLKIPSLNPMVPDRINAVNMALKDENGEITVEVDPGCQDLIDDLEQVMRDGKGGIRKTFNPADPYRRRTHSSDALGYWIAYEKPVRRVVDLEDWRASQIKQPGYAFSQ